MPFNPNEPRDKDGKWTSAASGHNAGGGNRNVKSQISLEFESSKIVRTIVENKFKIKQGNKNIVNLNTEINLRDRKHVEIKNVESLKGPHSFGPGHVKNLIAEIKKTFPRAETIGGNRISGARAKSDPRVTLDENARATIKVKK